MTVLVTGSAGHLGEAIMRSLRAAGRDCRGIDVKPSTFTDHVGSVSDSNLVQACMTGVTSVLHTATLHKPHVATHGWLDFIDTNIVGTTVLLEAAHAAGVSAFVFTSTTSTFGHALRPGRVGPAVWVDEDLAPDAKNIYGATKLAAENIAQIFHHKHGLPVIVLRTSRFFPEEDDNAETRATYPGDNAKVNEFLFRRVDIEDVVSAHLCALEAAGGIGFGRYIISATSPFDRSDLVGLWNDASAVVGRYFPSAPEAYQRLGWTMFPKIDRVYVNARARTELGWSPVHSFGEVLSRVIETGDVRSPMAKLIGVKGYHDQVFDDGPYPVE